MTTAVDVKKEQPPSRRRALRRRLALWAIVMGGLAVLSGGLFHCYLRRPVGSGPAGPDVPEAPFREVWSDKQVLLLGIGDSVTAGYGARKGYSYFDRLVRNPEGDVADMKGKCLSQVFPNLSARNIAVSGTTSIDHLDRQVPKLEPQPEEVLGIVVMSTGGNDLIHDYGRSPPVESAMYGATMEQAKPWIENFRKRLDTMVRRIRGSFAGESHVFLANIFDPTDGTGSTGFTGLPSWPDALRILSAYNQVLAECADRYEFVHLVDIHGPFLGHGLHCTKFWLEHYRFSDPHYWYSIVEDPNERGYDAIRRLFLLEMIEVFAP